MNSACRWLAAPLLLAACAQPPIRKPDHRPLPTGEQVLMALEQASASRRSLRAVGRVDYFGDQGRVRVRVVEVVERPDRFRFETLSPLEQPIDLMTCDGARLRLLSKGTLSEGPATPENIARLLPLALRPEEVATIMLGGVPLSSRFRARTVEWAEEDLWKVTLDGPGGEVAELTVDPTGPAARSLTIKRAGGVVRLGLTFADFEPVPGGGGLPRSIEVDLPERSQKVSLRLKEVEANVELSPTLFTIVPPPGVVPAPLPSPPVQVSGD